MLCYSCVTVMLLLFYCGVIVVLQLCYCCVPVKLLCYCCFAVVSLLCYCCVTAVSLLCYCDLTGVKTLPPEDHFYNRVVTQGDLVYRQFCRLLWALNRIKIFVVTTMNASLLCCLYIYS